MFIQYDINKIKYKMVDRLHDLASYNRIIQDDNDNNNNRTNDQNDTITEIIKPIQEMDQRNKLLFETIHLNINKLNNTMDKAYTIVSNDDKKRINQSIDDLIYGIDIDMLKAKKTIDQMSYEKKRRIEMNVSQTVRRIIDNIISTNVKKFSNETALYSSIRDQNDTRNKEKVRRQLKIVDAEKYSNVSDEEVQKIIDGKRNLFDINVYNDIQERHSQILELEKSLVELAQLFKDMQLLVNDQGILIDTIEDNVVKADAYVEHGVKDLQDANYYQKKSRKKKCCIIICVTVVVVIIILVLTLGVNMNNKTL